MNGEPVTLNELCRVTRLEVQFVQDLVKLGIIEPDQSARFSLDQLRIAARTRRVKEDFDLNMQGAVLAIELAEQNRRLQRQVGQLERLLKRLQS